MPNHWKHTATRCAVEGCERTRVKGWTTCAQVDHYAQGVSLYGLKTGEPRLLPPREGGRDSFAPFCGPATQAAWEAHRPEGAR
jgi:hypothetical protein